jgi:hypothetical protein
MTEQDALKDVAKKLTVTEAFTFDNPDDIWESVTNRFLILTGGDYGTTITWSSDKTNIVNMGGIDPSTGKQIATVSRPAHSDQNVILTATIRLNNVTLTKTYLLVVKEQARKKQQHVNC